MWTLDQKLRLLRSRSDFVWVEAAEASIEHGDDEELRATLAHLLDAAEEVGGPGWRALEAALLAWPRLTPAEHAALVDAARLHLPTWLVDRAASDDPTLAFLIASDLLLALQDRHHPANLVLDPEAFAGPLDHVVAQAFARESARPEARVLEAVLAAAERPGPKIRALLHDADLPAHLPLRALARQRSPRVSAATLIRWLDAPALTAVAREALESRLLAGDEDAFASGHLLTISSRAAVIRRFMRLDRVFQNGMPALSEPARRGAMGWLKFSGVRPGVALNVLSPLIADPSPLIRLDAARLLAELEPAPECDLALRDFALDPEEAVAFVAAAALASARSPARKRSLHPFFETLRRSPHGSVREIIGSVRAGGPVAHEREEALA